MWLHRRRSAAGWAAPCPGRGTEGARLGRWEGVLSHPPDPPPLGRPVPRKAASAGTPMTPFPSQSPPPRPHLRSPCHPDRPSRLGAVSAPHRHANRRRLCANRRRLRREGGVWGRGSTDTAIDQSSAEAFGGGGSTVKIFFAPRTRQMMTFLDPRDALAPEMPLSISSNLGSE